ncbi:MAG: hypothetical protein ACPIA7_04485, partial [Akkermansiaceae bacterium]
MKLIIKCMLAPGWIALATCSTPVTEPKPEQLTMSQTVVEAIDPQKDQQDQTSTMAFQLPPQVVMALSYHSVSSR